LKHLLWRLKNRYLLGLFDGYLSVGSRAREMLLSLGASPCRIHASPHCVDNDFFSNAAAPHQTAEGRRIARAAFGVGADNFVVLFAGKIEVKKRPLQVIQALARLPPGAALLLVGTGPLEEQCRAEAQRLGVRIAWAGFLNQTEIARAYAAADCLALPSDSGETWGLVVNEAMATGLPCVVSDRVGCGPDLVTPGETGEVVPLDNISALAEALDRIRMRQSEGHDFAPACRRRLASHSYSAATVGLLAACQDSMQRRQSPRRGQPTSCSPRIIACCGNLVTGMYGLERMTFEVLRGQRAQGAAVHCIVNSWENHRITPLADEIGASWSIGSYYHSLFLRHSLNPLRFAQAFWDVVLTSAGLLKDAARFRPTHIFVPDYLAVLRNAAALPLLRMLGVDVILRLGNAPDPGRFYQRLWRWVINPLVTRFVSNSRFTQAELLSHGINPEKSEFIYNSTPNRKVSGRADAVEHDPSKVIYVGQILPGKGVDVLLDACGLLVARGREVRLDIVGNMSGWEAPGFAGFREKLRARAGQPDLAGRVRFLGHREDVPALLRGAALHCCPSLPAHREAFGLVNIEAKEAGLPTVCFRAGALPELVEHRVSGWICADVSATALAEGLEFFLEDPDRIRQAGMAARDSMERFSNARFATAWNEVFSARGRRR
jgi:glycosyltransferase involved in cell wall biosynthesis